MLSKLKKAKLIIDDKMGRKSRALFRNKFERAKLKNDSFTLFSQNCIGSIMYHDLGLQFKSPTINLMFSPKDFILFMKDIHHYLDMPIEFIESEKRYPVGRIDNILIKFVHYHSEESARDAWEKRKERINWDNVFVLCCDEGLTHDDMVEFDGLPYKNKILFMHSFDPSIKCGIYARGYPVKTDAHLLEFCSIFGKRNYQKYINYVDWLNQIQ